MDLTTFNSPSSSIMVTSAVSRLMLGTTCGLLLFRESIILSSSGSRMLSSITLNITQFTEVLGSNVSSSGDVGRTAEGTVVVKKHHQ